MKKNGTADAPRPEKSSEAGPPADAAGGYEKIVGYYFHTMRDGALNWQGKVLSYVGDGVYFVQLYEWIMGEPNQQRLVKLAEMMDWDFFDDAETWVDRAKAHQRRTQAEEERRGRESNKPS